MLTKPAQVTNKSPVLRRCLSSLFLGAGALAFTLTPKPANAAEDPLCLSTDPSKWPAAAKPYFMLVVDTSGSMVACTNPVGDQYKHPEDGGFGSCPSTAVAN